MEITVTLTTRQENILKHDLLDIDEWVQQAVTGKISKCRKRLVDYGMPILLADETIETLPATEDGIIDAIVAHAAYENRSERLAEE